MSVIFSQIEGASLSNSIKNDTLKPAARAKTTTTRKKTTKAKKTETRDILFLVPRHPSRVAQRREDGEVRPT